MIKQLVLGKTDANDPDKDSVSFSLSPMPVLAAEVLAVALSLSLAKQIWDIKGAPNLFSILLGRAVLGYGDPLYFITASFVWLQGLFFFIRFYSDTKVTCAGETSNAKCRWAVDAPMVRFISFVYTVFIAFFFLLQYLFRIPEGWAGAGFQSPFEDISSFGSIAVSLFIFFVASGATSRWSASNLVPVLILGAIVVASWSRGAWLAAVIFLIGITAYRSTPKLRVAIALAIAIAVVLINGYSDINIWRRQPYLARLASLVRFESLEDKDSGRHFLYNRGVKMVYAHPLVGSGIGSFYLKSINYARESDPDSRVPNFAHNMFLQIAAEEGIPLALLFSWLTGFALLQGLNNIRGRQPEMAASSNARSECLPLLLALGAYIQTQMTANSLNVYVTNQYFFWFLLVAIFTNTELCRRENLNEEHNS